MSHRMEGSRRCHHTKVEHQVETCERRGRGWTEARLSWWHAQHVLMWTNRSLYVIGTFSRLGRDEATS
jgi:hypothetical protein